MSLRRAVVSLSRAAVPLRHAVVLLSRAAAPLRHAVVLLLVVALVATACRNEDNTEVPVEEQDRIIATANTTDDPSEIRITWFTAPCETFDRVDVDLDDQYANLTVRVTVDVENCPESAIDETVVDLGEPLGDREIWDRAFGNTVALDVE